MLYVEGFERSECVSDEEVFELVFDNRNFLRGSSGNSELDVTYCKRWLRKSLASVCRVGPKEDKYWLMQVFEHGEQDPIVRRKGILFSIGHELGHIFWKDHMPGQLKKRWFNVWVPLSWSEAREEEIKLQLSVSRRKEMVEDFCDSVADVILLPESQWSLWQHYVHEMREKIGGKIG